MNKDSNYSQLLSGEDGLNLSRLNLNLLPSLKALLDTRSVTEAAKLLCVTQPTMSRNLAQLRESLCDPILVRRGSQTTLSELGRTLQSRVNRLVIEASSVFENACFDPHTSRKHFRIAGNHMVVERVLPRALCDLTREAPNFSFEVELLDYRHLDRLHSGEIDLALGYFGSPPSGLRSQEIIRFRLSCLMSKTHPLANRVFTIEDIMKYPHVVQTSSCSSAPVVESYCRMHGIRPKIASPSYNATMDILANSDYLCLHSPVRADVDSRILSRQLPDEAPEVDARIVWPDYWNANRSHRWLRDRIYQHMSQALGQFYETVSMAGGAWDVEDNCMPAAAVM